MCSLTNTFFENNQRCPVYINIVYGVSNLIENFLKYQQKSKKKLKLEDCPKNSMQQNVYWTFVWLMEVEIGWLPCTMFPI